MEPIPTTGHVSLDRWLAILGTVVTLASFAATWTNGKVRAAIDAQEEVPLPFLYVSLVFNYAACNFDKTAQLHRLLSGAPAKLLIVAKPKDGSDA
jgi:hypothetical protein